MKLVSSKWLVVSKSVSYLPLCAMFLAMCVSVDAEQPTRIRRIAIIRGDANATFPGIKIFSQALQELGYVEGKNLLFEYRYTEGSRERAQAIVGELVGLKVDVLFSTQAIVVRAAKQATTTIPIVM